MVGHVAPEAASGGPIAAVREGDPIAISIANRTINLDISDGELRDRLSQVKPPAPKYQTGVFAKYVKLVSSAAEGAVTG